MSKKPREYYFATKNGPSQAWLDHHIPKKFHNSKYVMEKDYKYDADDYEEADEFDESGTFNKPFKIRGDGGKMIELWKIIAIKKLPGVPSGSYGGLVESYDNLSQEGDCWLEQGQWINGRFVHTCVMDNAKVTGNAKISNGAKIAGNVEITDNAVVDGMVKIMSKSAEGTVIHDDAHISGKAKIFGTCDIGGNAKVFDNAKIQGIYQIDGNAKIHGNAELVDNTKVTNISGNEDITGDE